jgi:mono/diheme cytochrome c family protein
MSRVPLALVAVVFAMTRPAPFSTADEPDKAPAGPASPPLEAREVYAKVVKPFLQAHCVKCHNDKETRAGFRIDTLGADFLVGKTADHWKEIYDNIGLGNMPPKKEPRPAISDAKLVMDWIDQEIRDAKRRARNSSGRTRRLNRTEYFNTLRDLFDLDENYVRSLVDELPPDGKLDGFDRARASLFIDQAQLAKYFELADRVLNERVLMPKPSATVPIKEFAKDMRWRTEHNGGTTTLLKPTERFGTIFLGPMGWTKTLATLPTGARIYELKNGGIEYLAGGKDFHIGSHGVGTAGNEAGGGYWAGRLYTYFTKITQEGKYRLTLRAGAFAGRGKHAVENVKVSFDFGKYGETANRERASVVIDAPLDQPKDVVMEVYLHPRPEVAVANTSNLNWNGVSSGTQAKIGDKLVQTGLIVRAPDLFALEDELVSEYHRTAYLEGKKGTPPQKINEILTAQFPAAVEKHERLVAEYVRANKPAFSYNPDFDLASIPRLFIESWEVEGPIVEWPPRGRRELFFAGKNRAIDARYIREIFARFLPRAYRRAVEPEEVDVWVDWVFRAQKNYELSGFDAVKEGIKAVLCSPGFLFIQEPTGAANKPQTLTDYELASRLSYFLWSTMPDGELIRLAAKNQLHEPRILEAQVRRLIADPRVTGFVHNFTGQWLQVCDFDKTATDRNAYKSYNEDLKKSSWQEPYEFFRTVLGDDLSILNFVDSEFVVIDPLLAAHYGIGGVKGDGFRKVSVRPEHHRGGVLGMAGVLTYLTDGLRTLPVRRAAYVVDTLWNEPAKPPPPNAGDLPAVKGKNLTVRQRLEQHRNSAMCASCHARLDPFGVALENYDAIGKWRDRQNGEGFQGDDKSPALDVSGTLPSGRAFKDLVGYKQALLAEKARFVRGFTQKLLTYALGRSVGATDREMVDGIVNQLERDQYRMQSLLQAVVASEAFRMK